MRNNKLEYYFVWVKTMTHSGSNSFSQVDYIFTIAKSLSIVVFIIKFIFMEQFKYGKCLHYWSLVSFALDGFFCFRCYNMYFSKLIHCRSSHCQPISFSVPKIEHFLFFLNCVHCVTFKGKIIHSKAQSGGTKFVAYEISILCSFSHCQLWGLGFKPLNSNFILVSILVN